MPWVNQEICTSCNTCITECPVGAIVSQEEAVHIVDEKCIRCGHCHDICPFEAIRHDGEKIPAEVAANLRWVQQLADHEYYSDSAQKQELIERLKRYFTKQKKVAELTIRKLEEMEL